MDDELERERQCGIDDGVLNPDGSRRHTCPWCCESWDYVHEHVTLSWFHLREYLDGRPRWWSWLHPLRSRFLRGRLDAYAEILDESGK
jgi:hypothetical protein